jgi:hypothetical protein
MNVLMPPTGKFCRLNFLLLIVLFAALLPRVDAGISIDLGKLFGRGNLGYISESDIGSGDSNSQASASRSGASAGKYLQVARVIRVNYEVQAGPLEEVKTSPMASRSMQGVPRYSDFLKQMEASGEAAEASRGKKAGESDGGLNSPGNESGSYSSGEVEGAERSPAESSKPDPIEFTLDAGVAPASDERPPLFNRRRGDQDELSRVLMFHSSGGFDAEEHGNYNILSPLDRGVFFTPPSSALPETRSSARYRSTP